MADRFDVGTPLGGERKYRRVCSPLHEMDDVSQQLFKDDDLEEKQVPVPTTPSRAQPVTLEGIAALLDNRLKPVVHAESKGGIELPCQNQQHPWDRFINEKGAKTNDRGPGVYHEGPCGYP